MKRLYAAGIVLLLALAYSGVVLTGCSDTIEKTAVTEPKEIIWYLAVDELFTDQSMVFDELNKYLADQIGVRVKPILFKNSDYNTKVPVVINAGQDFDICFTASWGNKFLPNVEKGVYADLTELLGRYAPETREAIPEVFWKSVTVNERIYAIPSYKEMGAQTGILFNSDMAAELGLEMSSIQKLEDLEPVLEKIRKADPSITPLKPMDFNSMMPAQMIDTIGAVKIPSYDYFAEYEKGQAFNLYESKDFEAFCKLMRRWNQAGYLNEKTNSSTNTRSYADRIDAAGKLFASVVSYAPGYEQARAAEVKHGVGYIPLTRPLYSRNTGMMAVSAASGYKKEALQFLNLLNTDRYVGTLVRHGIKGVHYTEIEKTDSEGNRVTQADQFGTGFTAENHPYNYSYGWQFGNVFNQIWSASYSADIEQIFMDYNARAEAVPYLDFSFVQSPVSEQESQVANVVYKYRVPLEAGNVEVDEMLAAFRREMKECGSDEIIAEINAQLEPFREN